MTSTPTPKDYDYVIVGSGFGGSVSALRLSEKGWRVLVIEKGKWLTSKDFPKTNWNLRRWLWAPAFRFFGLFKLTFFRHVTVLSGVGVGGGSLVYANTLPIPKRDFFTADSWAHLADWESELAPYYPIALKMLGAAINPRLEIGDLALQELAAKIGKSDHFEATRVAVYFGEPGKKVPDPYFNGKGPERVGCNFCGGCMLGCRFGAKNTLDKNYLYLAQQNSAQVVAESEVVDVVPIGAEDGSGGYRIVLQSSTRFRRSRRTLTTRGVVFSGGVLGTVPLLLKLKKSSLPHLSDRIGDHIRTNSESLLGVTTFDLKKDFSKGIAIGSILHTDEHSHLEPVRYPEGSGAWRILGSPMTEGPHWVIRLAKAAFDILRHPIRNTKIYFVPDWAKHTQILLFMQTISSTLRFRLGFLGMKSQMEQGNAPTAFIPESRTLAKQFAELTNGQPVALLTDTIMGIPTTAHILGGAAMGKDAAEGVIDKDHRVFGYTNMYICDGSSISANPGVNPSLTITALAERAMSNLPVNYNS